MGSPAWHMGSHRTVLSMAFGVTASYTCGCSDKSQIGKLTRDTPPAPKMGAVSEGYMWQTRARSGCSSSSSNGQYARGTPNYFNQVKGAAETTHLAVNLELYPALGEVTDIEEACFFLTRPSTPCTHAFSVAGAIKSWLFPLSLSFPCQKSLPEAWRSSLSIPENAMAIR